MFTVTSLTTRTIPRRKRRPLWSNPPSTTHPITQLIDFQKAKFLITHMQLSPRSPTNTRLKTITNRNEPTINEVFNKTNPQETFRSICSLGPSLIFLSIFRATLKHFKFHQQVSGQRTQHRHMFLSLPNLQSQMISVTLSYPTSSASGMASLTRRLLSQSPVSRARMQVKTFGKL